MTVISYIAATAINAILSLFRFRKNLLEEDERSPMIIPEIRQKEGALYLVMKNTGKGVAYDVKVEFEQNFIADIYIHEGESRAKFLEESQKECYVVEPGCALVYKISAAPLCEGIRQRTMKVYITYVGRYRKAGIEKELRLSGKAPLLSVSEQDILFEE